MDIIINSNDTPSKIVQKYGLDVSLIMGRARELYEKDPKECKKKYPEFYELFEKEKSRL